MKKFLALLISVAMVLALVAIPAAAEGEATFTAATVNDVQPGSTVDVTITAEMNGNEAHTLVGELLYDPNYLTVTAYANGPITSGLIVMDDWQAQAAQGRIALGLLGVTNGLTQDGVYSTVTFQVSEDCTVNQVLTLNITELDNSPLGGTATPIDVVSVNGAINVVGGTDETPVPPTDVPPTDVPPTEVPPTEVPPVGGNATIILNVPSDVWGDGSGYQMLLDADATAYGTIIPETGGLTSSGNASAATYAEFEYKIPENADGSLTTSNIIVTGQGSVVVPAGTYDYCITNPTPGDRVWIASSNGTAPGRYDDFEFEANKTYTFTVTFGGTNDRVDLEITDSGEPTDVPPTDVPPTDVPPTDQPPVDGLIAGYYFETAEEVNEWTFIGTNDTNWVWSENNPGGYDYSELAHEGSRFIMSYSFVDYVGAYQADNWAISPAVSIPDGPAHVSFYASNANVSYPESIDVYVGLTANPDDMMLLQANVTPNTGYDDPWTHYDLDLTNYGGETIYLGFYDHCYDMYEIWIDQVEFFGEGGSEPTDVPPTDVPPTDVPPVTEAGSATITMGSEYGVPGGAQITLPLTVEGEYNAHTFNGAITYDPAVLSVVGVELGDVVPEDAYYVIDYETNPGTIAIGLVMPGEEMSGNGVIANVTFNVADPFTAETPVNINVYEMNYVPETTGIPVEVELVDGVVTPLDVPPTDVPPTDVPPTDVPPTEVPPVEGVVFTMGSEYEVPGGADIVLPLTIAGEYEAHILNMDINYDPEKLTVTGVELGDVLASKDTDPVIVLDYETIPGRIALGVIMPEQPFSGEGTLLNVSFKVADPFEEETPVTLDVKEFSYMPIGDTDETPIEFTAVDGIVTPVGVPGPTDEPVEPTDVPVEPTDEPVEPTDEPGPTPPNPPVTGTVSLIGLGIMAIAAGAGVVIFRRKED